MRFAQKKLVIQMMGTPVAQGRPRFTCRGKYVKAFDPKKSAEAKMNFRLASSMAVQQAHWDMLSPDVPVHIKINFYMPLPQSAPTWKKKAAERGLIAPCVKPDLVDNGAKLCLDAMSGIVYCDDKQVVELECHKMYVHGVDDITGEEVTGPCTIVEVQMDYVNIGEIKEALKAQGLTGGKKHE